MWPFKRKPAPKVFTGNCMVYQHTGDGAYAGRCYHSTYNGVCHLHGDVSWSLSYGFWYNDFEIDRGEDVSYGGVTP